MSDKHPTVGGVLAQTIAIAPLNMLPMAMVALVFQLPLIVLPRTEALVSLLPLQSVEGYLYLHNALAWVAATFTFYGAIEALHGRRVGFRDCFVKGVLFALPIALPVFALGFAVGAAWQLHPLAGLGAFLASALMPFTWAMERHAPIRAARRGLDDAIRYPWLIAPTILTVTAVELCQAILWNSNADVYNHWLAGVWNDISLLLQLFVSVLFSCACATLYAAMRRDSERM